MGIRKKLLTQKHFEPTDVVVWFLYISNLKENCLMLIVVTKIKNQKVEMLIWISICNLTKSNTIITWCYYNIYWIFISNCLWLQNNYWRNLTWRNPSITTSYQMKNMREPFLTKKYILKFESHLIVYDSEI